MKLIHWPLMGGLLHLVQRGGLGGARPFLAVLNVTAHPLSVPIGAVSGNGIIKINLLLHAFPVVTANERNVISIAFRHRSVHDGHNCRGTTGQWS